MSLSIGHSEVYRVQSTNTTPRRKWHRHIVEWLNARDTIRRTKSLHNPRMQYIKILFPFFHLLFAISPLARGISSRVVYIDPISCTRFRILPRAQFLISCPSRLCHTSAVCCVAIVIPFVEHGMARRFIDDGAQSHVLGQLLKGESDVPLRHSMSPIFHGCIDDPSGGVRRRKSMTSETRHENTGQPDGGIAPILVDDSTRHNSLVHNQQYLASSCDDLLGHLQCVQVEEHHGLES